MLKSSGIGFLIIGVIALVIAAIVVIGIILNNRYLNKRLKGETERKKFFKFRSLAIVMIFSLCVISIAYLAMMFAYMRGNGKVNKKDLKNTKVIHQDGVILLMILKNIRSTQLFMTDLSTEI